MDRITQWFASLGTSLGDWELDHPDAMMYIVGGILVVCVVVVIIAAIKSSGTGSSSMAWR